MAFRRRQETDPGRKRRGKGPVAVAAGLLAGLLISGFTVWNASEAAFSGLTDNQGSSWRTNKIALTDNDNGTSLFTATNLTPTTVTTQCIEIEYTGDVTAPNPVYLYGSSSAVTGSDLSNYLDLKIEVGTQGANPAFGCAGFSATSTLWNTGTLYDFQTTYHSYGSGLSTGWTPAVGEVRSYRFSTTVQNTNNANGKSVSSVPFTWETQAY